MTPSTAETVLPLRAVTVRVSDDRMLAELEVDASAEQPVTIEMIKEALSAAKVPAPADEALTQLIQQIGPDQTEPVVVARGTPPVDDTPAVFELINKQPDVTANGALSHYDRNCFVTTTAGQAIARVTPRVEGHNGADVHGKVLPCKHPRGEPFTLGMNVGMAEDGLTVVARIDGRLRYERGKVWVEPLLEIPSDVDFSVGNISFAGDVHIRKNVLDLFHVTSNGNISIDGTVEAAHVTAGGTLIVRGGVVGKDKGLCQAKGNISVKYATNANIQTEADVHAQVEICSSMIDCGGMLNAEQAAVVGGRIRARGGVKCGTLGCPVGTLTLVEVGIDHPLHDRIAEQLRTLRALQKEDRWLREKVTPFAKDVKHLSADQRKMVSDLLHKAKEDETKAAELILALRQSLQAWQANSKPEVHVAKTIYPGVTIRFPQVQCTIDTSFRGPLTLAPRPLDGTLQIFAIPPEGRGHPIASHPIVDDVIEAAQRAISE